MSTRLGRCYSSWKATLQGNTDHFIQEQGMGQTNRDVRVNMFCSCGYFTLLFCLSLHPSRPSPLSPLLFHPTADDATASSPDGSNTRVLPEPHGSHRCRANAANGSFQCQWPGGYSHDTVVRYTLTGTHRHTLTEQVALMQEQRHMQTNTHTDTLTHRAFLSISHYWPGIFSSLARIIEAVCNIFIQGLCFCPCYIFKI